MAFYQRITGLPFAGFVHMKKFLSLFFSLNKFSLTFYAIIFVVLLFMAKFPFLESIELKTYDLRLLSRGKLIPSPHVVIAAIDERSLNVEGRWPWPRSKLARLVDILSRDGARVIAFDVGFFEPDQASGLKVLEALGQRLRLLGIDEHLLESLMEEERIKLDHDLALASSFKNSNATIVLGYFFHMSPQSGGASISPHEIKKRLALISPSQYPLVAFKEGQEDYFFPRARVPQVNIEPLCLAARFSGYFNMFPDSDGSVRRMPMVIACGSALFPPLALEAARHFLSHTQPIIEVDSRGIKDIRMGEKFIPTDPQGHLLINYCGPPKTFPHYSVAEILRNNFAPGAFKDKVILVGATAVGIYDMRNTPVSPVFPGVEIHATVIDNILEGRFLKKPGWARIYDLLAIILLASGAGFMLACTGPLKGGISAAGLAFFHLGLSYFVFVSHGIWLNVLYPLLALSMVYTLVTAHKYFSEQRERSRIKGAFSQYVPSQVVSQMLKHPDKLKLGGEKRDLTVLFSDIRGFTSLSEATSPEIMVSLLNEYLTVMTGIVFKHQGTLDKYMGDAIMAFYGAPISQEDHPERACQTALEMLDALAQLNEKWVMQGKPALDVGIGINTGYMMVGNMGSRQRFDYTVVGDAVNLGARLEGANKSYGTNILIGEATYIRIKDRFTCLEVDLVRVKGKNLPIRIYELLAHGPVDPALGQSIKMFHEALELYRSRRWDEAGRMFANILQNTPRLRVAEVYVKRCKYLRQKPPGQHWDGVFIMDAK